jgi:hypothetical protein
MLDEQPPQLFLSWVPFYVSLGRFFTDFCVIELARSIASSGAQLHFSTKASNFEAGRAMYRENFPPDSYGPAHPPRSMPATLLTPRRRGDPVPGPNTPSGLSERQSRLQNEISNLTVSPPSLSENALRREAVIAGRVIQSDEESLGSPSVSGSPMNVDSPSTPPGRGPASNSPLGPPGSPSGSADNSAGGMGRFFQPATFSPSVAAEVASSTQGSSPSSSAFQEAVEFSAESPWSAAGFYRHHHYHGPGDAPRDPAGRGALSRSLNWGPGSSSWGDRGRGGSGRGGS